MAELATTAMGILPHENVDDALNLPFPWISLSGRSFRRSLSLRICMFRLWNIFRGLSSMSRRSRVLYRYAAVLCRSWMHFFAHERMIRPGLPCPRDYSRVYQEIPGSGPFPV